MFIFHSGLETDVLLKYQDIRPDYKPNVLLSFGRSANEMEEFCTTHREKINKLVLDSGVYTILYSKNKNDLNIDFEDYMEYCREYGSHFDYCFNFDADFSNEGYELNSYYQEKLQKTGIEVVPVVHNIYNDEVDVLIEKGHQRIAIGSNVLLSQEKLLPVVKKIYDAGRKCHLFGIAKFEFLFGLPAYSSDSSSWTQMGARDRVLFWNDALTDQVDKTDKIFFKKYCGQDIKDRIYLHNYAYRRKFEEYLDTLGITTQQLNGHYFMLYRRLVNLDYYVKLEALINTEHERQEWTFDNPEQ